MNIVAIYQAVFFGTFLLFGIAVAGACAYGIVKHIAKRSRA